MCLIFIITCFNRNKFCVNSNKNIVGHTICYTVKFSVAEPHDFYAAPVLGKNFDAAPGAPTPSLAPTLLYT
jgi:hypothetical protein